VKLASSLAFIIIITVILFLCEHEVVLQWCNYSDISSWFIDLVKKKLNQLAILICLWAASSYITLFLCNNINLTKLKYLHREPDVCRSEGKLHYGSLLG
jgi:hypothetical protein